MPRAGDARRAPEIPDPPPGGTPVSVLRHRIAFYETDAMGIVHHARYVHMLERARVAWLDEHDRPYREYVDRDLHFAVRELRVRYHRAVRFDDEVDVHVWVEQARGASLAIAYELRCHGERILSALSEHAMVDASGGPVRIPADRRRNLAEAAAAPRRQTG